VRLHGGILRLHVAASVAGLVAAGVLLTACSGVSPNTSAAGTAPSTSTSASTSTTGPPPSSSSSTSSTTATTAAPPTTATTTSTSTTPTTTVPPGPPALSLGDTGSGVLALQQRLSALGYWLGTPDGVFGDSTEQAVYALQKAAGIGRDGVVGPATEAALQRGVVPTPRSTSGTVVEVNLATDLLMIVDNGKLQYTLNTSTGGGYTYTSGGVTSVANTPVGVFHIFRVVDGPVVDSLGTLWRPRYFYSGFAIHGDSYVPPEPVSHGCVRVSDEAIDWIWDANLMPIGTEVWVY
jgi:lipoprotein-anchoring transpeptidase ErfK/SrfK